MKALINEDGQLKIERFPGYTVACYCPEQQDGSACGDWCPRFGEPVYHRTTDNKLVMVTIEICHHQVLRFYDGLMDERKGTSHGT